MRWLLLASVALWACDDGGSGAGSEPDADVWRPDAGDSEDARLGDDPDDGVAPDPDGAVEPPEQDEGVPGPEPDEGVEPPPPDAAPPEPAAWVEVSLNPRWPLYDLDDEVTATATAWDRHGFETAATLRWETEPPGIARVDEAGAMSLLGEGQGVVRACAGDVCGQAAFYVDADAPVLQVNEPGRGATLGEDGGATIRVSGTATDTGGTVTVRVNGVRVDLGEGGVFAIDLPAKPGINRIVTTADDGVRQPAVVDARDVLWAPEYLPVEADGVVLPAALTLRLDQAVLDADGALELPEGAGDVELTELAQIVEALLAVAAVDDLLGDPNVAGGEGFALQLLGVSLGEPEVDLLFSATGMEVFLRLPRVEIEVDGGLALEGEEIPLDGTLRAGIAAYAAMDLGLADDGGFAVEVVETGVAVESIGGVFEDPTAQVLVRTLGSRLRTVAGDLARGLTDQVIREELPGIVDDALGSLIAAVAEIPLSFDTGIEGAPPIDLMLRLTPETLTLRRERSMRVDLRGEVRQAGPVAAPHPDPGVLVLSSDDYAELPGDGFGAALRVGLINMLLHEIWRAGALNFAPPLPPEAGILFDAISIDAWLPPVVAPSAPGAERPLEVQIGDLRLLATRLGAQAPDIYSLNVRVGVTLAADGGAITLAVGEEPEVQAVLVEQGSDQPLSADALGGLVAMLVWPQVAGALDGGLGLALPAGRIDPGGLGDLAPRVQGITLGPSFAGVPVLEEGRMLIEGALGVTLTLGE